MGKYSEKREKGPLLYKLSAKLRKRWGWTSHFFEMITLCSAFYKIRIYNTALYGAPEGWTLMTQLEAEQMFHWINGNSW